LTNESDPAEHVVGGVLRREGRLFLFHRRPDRASYPSLWDVPGGHVDEGESIADALVRELAEELGIHVEPPDGDPWVTVRSNGLELHLFLIDRWTGEARNLALDEHDDTRWVDHDELAHLELADPSYLAVLRQALLSEPGWLLGRLDASDQGSSSE
jgi:mutator protein MutT